MTGPLLILSWVSLAVALVRPAGRSRLERFARRQRLTVTTGNGEPLIRYLATTGRWRTAGLAAGLMFATVRAVGESTADPRHSDGLAWWVPLFMGWFLGALVAEIRVGHLAHGPVRTASLRPRRPADYLGRFAWRLVPVAGGLAVVVATVTLGAVNSGDAATDWTAVAWLVASLAVAIVVRVIQHMVLSRPQPVAAPDVLAADDAIRSRSLHVLAGGGAATVLMCVWAQLEAVRFHGYHLDPGRPVIFADGLSIVVLGLLVATNSWPPPGRAEPTQAPLANTP